MILVSIDANPAPPGAFVGSLKAADGTTLRYARFEPPPNRKGTVCVLQGRAEFIEKYFEVATELRARGFAVVTLDWRGQGLSDRKLKDPRKGHVSDFRDYDRDLDAFVKQVLLPDCPPPYYALAHSTGATILLRAAHRGRRWFERIVVTAPLIDVANLPSPRTAKFAARLMRGLGFGTSYIPRGGATAQGLQLFPGNLVTSDPVRYARNAAIIEAHPALGTGSPTIGWVNAAFRAMQELQSASVARNLRQPLLVVAAGQDRIVSSPAIERFALRLRTGAQVVIPGAMHEILMERDVYRAQFWAAFDAFVPGSGA